MSANKRGPCAELRELGQNPDSLPLSLGRLWEGRANVLGKLAGSTGLEPAASGVTGRRSNQLNYDPKTSDVCSANC